MGINTADDAGVFLLTEGLALVQTVDLLTPIVEDPYIFGKIAATNSLSDVYAMGGEPLTALNIVGFPAALDKTILREILRGGQDAVKSAGAIVVGGHTFNEKEIKYGLAVTGKIDPNRIITNANAQPNDLLILTKPLGTGVFAQAIMNLDEVDPELTESAIKVMTQLNRQAKTIMLACFAHSATDITGYGLIGHCQEMAEASRVKIRIYAEKVPLLPKVRELAKTFTDPGVFMNETSFGNRVQWLNPVSEELKNILFESETSGGLLIALPPEKAKEFQKRARDEDIIAEIIGEVHPGTPGTIEVQ